MGMDSLIPVCTAHELRQADAATITGEPISGYDLMERAAWRLTQALLNVCSPDSPFHIVCGPGNNGGDGLAMARILASRGCRVRVSLCLYGKTLSQSAAMNRNLLNLYNIVTIQEIQSTGNLRWSTSETVIDCLFGSGLSHALGEMWAETAEQMNQSGCNIISIDSPSGLFDEQPQGNAVFIRASKTLSIQCPRPSFFYPENKVDFQVVDIGIHTSILPHNAVYLSPDHTATEKYLQSLLPARQRHSHKGHYGHALLVGGSAPFPGSIAMSARACVQSGAGLTTVWCAPESRPWLVQNPRAMVWPQEFTSASAESLEESKYNSLLIGPGLGTSSESLQILAQLLHVWRKPVILDADALNLLSKTPAIWKMLPQGSLLTPHPGEFTRLFGHTASGYEKFEIAAEKAANLGLHIMAKDSNSVLFTPDGKRYFNGSGDARLAQGGSGDSLSGLAAGYFAQTQNMESAAILAMHHLPEFAAR
ncbi:MAG: NAD(P)H-hydrate dehydratase [Bacteroidetes bacterium]|nr:NAD(P)H-hydrate dehydratase [Bacteroidota bacterium]